MMVEGWAGFFRLQAPDCGIKMQPRFVVQKHRARTLHYDFRLEREGVFRSWAVPKGIPEAWGVRRLAVQVPDHPLEWGSFEGTIPEGQYGAGTVEIWDEGTYEALEWSEDVISFVLCGRRLRGTYSLVRFSRKGPRDWLLFRRGDGTELGHNERIPRSP
jgi:bifunctional non-homologous end joining protein LigD